MAVEASHHVTMLNNELAGKFVSFASFLHWITWLDIRFNVFSIIITDITRTLEALASVVHAAAERRRRRFFCHAAAAEKNERRDSAWTVSFENPTETKKFLEFDHRRYKVSWLGYWIFKIWILR